MYPRKRKGEWRVEEKRIESTSTVLERAHVGERGIFNLIRFGQPAGHVARRTGSHQFVMRVRLFGYGARSNGLGKRGERNKKGLVAVFEGVMTPRKRRGA